MTHKIDIKEPIWKNPRSVGLHVTDIPLGENVEVSISYRNKNGELLWPDSWTISADTIKRYPSKAVRSGIILNLVPIDDLYNLDKKVNTINNQNIKPMLFDKKSLDKIITASAEASKGNNLKKIEPGKHILSVKGIELSHAKSDGNPMIVVEFEKDEDHRSFKEFFKIAGPNTDIPREKLVKLFHRGFGYQIQPCKDEKGLIDQLTAFEGKELTVAVKGRKKVFSAQKDGKDELIETTEPVYWYCGTKSEYDDFYIDLAKAVVELSDEDKEKLIKFAELQDDEPTVKKKSPPKKKIEETPEPAEIETADDEDDFPF